MAYASITKPSLHFNTKLYTGTGSNGNAITGVGFQPDLIWIKDRVNTYSHRWYDVIRGVNSAISSDNGNAASQYSQYGQLESIDSDGFTVGQGSSNGAAMNDSGDGHASWNWKAGGAGSSNSNGSITSTVSANATSGFSIVKYTGTGSNATVGHGLSSAPKAVFVKNYSSGSNYDWICYHKDAGNTGFLRLNTNNAYDTSINMFNSTDPTSTVFSIGSHAAINGSSDNFIAYCFSDVTGFSKFGKYKSTSNADNAFVYTGFKPSFSLIKRLTATDSWILADKKLSNINGNPTDDLILPNATNAELANNINRVDLLSNGFKVRPESGASATGDGSTDTFIYLTFAEEPLVANVGTSIPATAE